MRNVFLNPELEVKFQKDGYVRVPFISKEEVEELKQLFFDSLPSSGGQITAGETGVQNSNAITYDFTFIDKNPDYKRKVFDIITKRFKVATDAILDNYKPIIANYIRKQTETGEVPLHQNWAFANDRKCSTISIWCPLVDSTVENGTLQVVPGSHKRFGEVRGPMVPWELDAIKKEIIERHLIPLETTAGECVILDDSIVHYSAVNKTNDLRLAIQLICIPAEMPSWHYNMDSSVSSNEVNILEVDVDFYFEFNPWKKPENFRKVKTIPYLHRAINEQEFMDRLNRPGFDTEKKTGFFAKIKELLKD